MPCQFNVSSAVKTSTIKKWLWNVAENEENNNKNETSFLCVLKSIFSAFLFAIDWMDGKRLRDVADCLCGFTSQNWIFLEKFCSQILIKFKQKLRLKFPQNFTYFFLISNSSQSQSLTFFVLFHYYYFVHVVYTSSSICIIIVSCRFHYITLNKSWNWWIYQLQFEMWSVHRSKWETRGENARCFFYRHKKERKKKSRQDGKLMDE